MPSITKLPSGKHYCQVRIKGEKPIYKTFGTFDEAREWGVRQESRLKQEAAYSRPIDSLAGKTFLNIGLAYCNTVLKGKKSQSITSATVKRIAPHFPQPFQKITKWDVNAYRHKRLETVSPTTCRDELVLISRFFRWIQKEMLIDLPNPVADVPLPKAAKPRDKVITQEELKQLLSVMQPDMRLIVELAYETAMRRSEILKLTPRNLHLEDRMLDVVDGKEGSRSVPLSRRAVELLRTATDGLSDRDTLLFPFKGNSVSQALRRARRQLGLSEDIRVHQLRHTRITEVARKGLNQAQLMAVSGHRDVRSVMRYTHLNVQDVVDLLD